jgi:hypothetical protein
MGLRKTASRVHKKVHEQVRGEKESSTRVNTLFVPRTHFSLGLGASTSWRAMQRGSSSAAAAAALAGAAPKR